MQTITAIELFNQLDPAQFAIIDVRETGEYAASAIAQSINIPLSRLCPAMLSDHLKPRTIVVCAVGERSAVAIEMMQSQFPAITFVNLTGGIIQWMREGLPTQTTV